MEGLKILVLGMNSTTRGELSYEGRIIHKLAEIPGVEVDYFTDNPLTYEKELILKKPERLNHQLFAKGSDALAKTPRTFHPKDVKWIVEEHLKTHGPEEEQLRKNYDIVFGTAQTAIDMGSWIKQVLDIPFVVQILDLPLWRLTPYGPHEIYKQATVYLPLLPHEQFESYVNEWSYWIGKCISQEVDRVVTILETVKEQMVTAATIPADKISVVKHGSIDYETVMWHRKEYPAEKRNQVIVLERHAFHKGVDQSIAICSLIKKQVPDAKFLFVSDGEEWYTKMLQDYAKLLLGDSVKFLGWVDNVTKFRLLRESKVLLCQEWPEGFGSVCLAEAVFCDAVPIVWDTKGKREVTNNKYAEYVTMGNFQEAADRAVIVLKEHTWTPEFFEEARKWTEQERSVRAHAEGLLEVFKRVVKE